MDMEEYLMSKIDHQIVGISVSFLIFIYLETLGYGIFTRMAAAFLAFGGATAPDWLEIAHGEKDYQGKWQRVSVIPHRTITHWVPLWIVPATLILWFLPSGQRIFVHAGRAEVMAVALGFLLGGISHLACDIPNPTGVPVLWPTAKHRISLRWWKSGSAFEWIEILAFWGITASVWFFVA